MKCVVVSQSNVYGGAEAYLNRLYSRLSEVGVSPLLIGSIPGWSNQGLPSIDIELGPKWSNRTIVPGVLQLRKEKRRLLKVVQAQTMGSIFHLQYKREQIGFSSLLSGFGPVVWTEHGRFLRGGKGAMLAAGYRAAAKHVAAIICVSEDVAQDVREVVGRQPRIEVVPSAVDTKALRPATAEQKAAARALLRIDREALVALWIGRVYSEKRPDLAIRLSSSEEWKGIVLFAGVGPGLHLIEEQGKHMPRLKIMGHVEDIETVYHAADVAMFTSSGSEGYPTTTMLEASAFGVPLLVNEESGASKYLNDSAHSVLSEAATGSDWARACAAIVTNEAQLAARSWSEQYNIESWTAAHRQILESVL